MENIILDFVSSRLILEKSFRQGICVRVSLWLIVPHRQSYADRPFFQGLCKARKSLLSRLEAPLLTVSGVCYVIEERAA